MARKSKKERIAELERKVNELDPQKIAERAVKNLRELPKDIQEQIRGIIRSETENLNDRLKKNVEEIEAVKEKINSLRNRIRENGKKVLTGIFKEIEKVFGPIFKIEADGAKEVEETEKVDTTTEKDEVVEDLLEQKTD
ncbi:unnamed protein product, partial [marine sediment metagenome]